jgi:hypothetical protein
MNPPAGILPVSVLVVGCTWAPAASDPAAGTQSAGEVEPFFSMQIGTDPLFPAGLEATVRISGG